jgi:prefoldin subunit 5
MVRRGKVLGEQFQTSVAPPVEHIFVIAQRESATWLRGLYKSVEKPLEDAHARLMQRAEGIEKAEAASQDLSAQITALQNTIEVIKSKHAVLTDARDGLKKFTGIGHRRERDASPAE